MAVMPVIGVVACIRQVGLHPYHIAGDKYLQAILAVGGLPLILPALGHAVSSENLLAQVDGLLLTGSPSNIEPHHYSGPADSAQGCSDPARDHTTLPLIRAACAAGVPLLGICRGFQEINVALGGSLHPALYRLPGLLEHREPAEADAALQYAARHALQVQPGGLLASLGLPAEFPVNSLHGQGIDRLAPALRIEGRAPDGLIEAVALDPTQGFLLGVQWHLEWQMQSNPQSLAIFQAFAEACRMRQKQR